MLKVGIVGIGSIASKAYLPVLSKKEGIECHICTRNRETLLRVGQRYRWQHVYSQIDQLIHSGIQVAFVHAATLAHPKLVTELLNHGISVYVDKPIADSYEKAKELTELARRKHVMLMTGFNRRYAPLNSEAKAVKNKTMVVLQKNRVNDPKDVRTFVFDDFIHVVDTIRYVLGGPVHVLTVRAQKNETGLFTGLTVLFSTNGEQACALMNRTSGANEEILQVMSPQGEFWVKNLVEGEWVHGMDKSIRSFNDWTPTLYKRGFPQIVDAFLEAAAKGKAEAISKDDALETHRLCEQIVRMAEHI
ncbi:Gfo/Idh/MocA family protein [Sporolactobacillus sp. THM19-2]|uniref:Gfo/Idh/MocA family protein n=1 Tax=Sporolactobacillus sp. THM19-2 TaxID=2511171 RepID=UPI00102051FC|nr:Gfo/Idh/MocA family oxidoreductase [Sporolactobacillus sp. THM19-2]RYL92214.1 Gfo/Idh/MocA family oxidoreductase [Sporolactobacillus sp. THM19-2]